MKKLLLIITFCFMFVLSGCDTAMHNRIYDDDAKIASSDSYNAIKSVGNTKGSEYTLSATITGAQTLWRYNAAQECDVEFSYSLNVSKGGKAKLVLVTPDNEIITLAENTNNNEDTVTQTQTISLKAGQNKIKVVGYDSPTLALKLRAEAGDLGK